MDMRILKAKSADHYTDEEIHELYSLCRNEYEYDFLTDRLYLVPWDHDRKHRNTKNAHEYSFLSTRVLKQREKSEVKISDKKL